MRRPDLRRAFTLIEPGPVVLVTTFDGRKHNIVVLKGLAAYLDRSREEKRTLHATDDGTFVADGTRFDRRKMMRAKLPDGV